MQEDEDIETHYKGHRWEGEMLDSDSEEGESTSRSSSS